MANKQFASALLLIALAIIQNVGSTSILKDIVKNGTHKSIHKNNTLPTQEPTTIELEEVQESDDGEDYADYEGYEIAKSFGKKKFIIIIANTTNITITDKPEKPFLGIINTDTIERIRAQFVAHRETLEDILTDSGLGTKVKIVYQARNLDSEEQLDDENIADIESNIESNINDEGDDDEIDDY